MTKRNLVCRNRNRSDRIGLIALRRMEQHGLLSVVDRPAKLIDPAEQLFEPVHPESDELRIHPCAFRPLPIYSMHGGNLDLHKDRCLEEMEEKDSHTY